MKTINKTKQTLLPIVASLVCLLAAGCEEKEAPPSYQALPLEEYLPGLWVIDPSCYYLSQTWIHDDTLHLYDYPDINSLTCHYLDHSYYPGGDSLSFSSEILRMPAQEVRDYVDFYYIVLDDIAIQRTSVEPHYVPWIDSSITIRDRLLIFQLDANTMLIPGPVTRIPFANLQPAVEMTPLFKFNRSLNK